MQSPTVSVPELPVLPVLVPVLVPLVLVLLVPVLLVPVLLVADELDAVPVDAVVDVLAILVLDIEPDPVSEPAVDTTVVPELVPVSSLVHANIVSPARAEISTGATLGTRRSGVAQKGQRRSLAQT